jgi:hypothetical protein
MKFKLILNATIVYISMKIISTLGKMHEHTVGYEYEAFIEYINRLKVKNALIAYTSRENFEENENSYNEIKFLKKSFNIDFPDIDFEKYRKLSEKYSFETHNAEEITKKNIIDIIETVINSYLAGYWKDPETVNSEVTDSIFRVKNKFILSVNPEYIEKYWMPLHKEIFDYIENYKNNYDAVISDVESTFYYKDQNL